MRKISCGIALAVLSFVSCKEERKDPQPSGGSQKSGPLPVEALIISTEPISESISVTGTILPYESTEIRPEISGRMTFLNIREGAEVRKGELLAKIFDGDLQAQLKKLRVQLQIAEKTEERQRELLKISGISQQDYDLSLLAVNNLNADIELTKVNIAKTEVRAPYAGRLGLKNVSPGAYISPQQVLTSISQLRPLKLEFSIPEKYSSQVSQGMPIRFTVEGSDAEYKASVSAKQSSVDLDTRNLTVRAVVNDADSRLVPGSFAKVNIILGRNDRAIMIPSQAILPVARGKQVVLYKGGEVIFRNVLTGVRDSANVQVLDGLTEGDTLLTTGLMFLRPDSKVRLSKVVKP
jgi:membrane fusion protein (multidrug efflux system)